MLLSLQQKYILESLRKLDCVKQDQLHALVRVVIPGTEMWEQEQARPDFLIQNSVLLLSARGLRLHGGRRRNHRGLAV